MNPLSSPARILAALVMTVAIARAANGQTAAPSMNESGKQLFATSCANSFCHGSEGGPGRGPRLRDRDWQQSYLYSTIEDGIAGSPMPAWKGRLSEQQIHAVIRYILSISREVPEEAKTQPAALRDATPAITAANDNTAARGKQLFFDLSNERNCGVCHRIGDAGLSVGPALSSLSNKSDAEIIASILQPQGEPALGVRTTSGEAICGIKAGGDAKTLQIYDIPSDGPPVLRTFTLEEIVSRSHCDLLNPHAGFSHLFTREQLSEIVAFLKSTTSAP